MDDANLEKLWNGLLSRQADRVRVAFESLAHDERKAVLEHLLRMAQEPGWHPEQRASARAALEVLQEKES